MNRLQFEKDHQQSSMMFNQQILAERLDRYMSITVLHMAQIQMNICMFYATFQGLSRELCTYGHSGGKVEGDEKITCRENGFVISLSSVL